MARQPKSQGQATAPPTTPKERGKRKPRQYRFELVDPEGGVEAVELILTHKQSAKDTLAYLNSLSKRLGWDETYRFTEVIVYQ
jgi:hypothetical protein